MLFLGTNELISFFQRKNYDRLQKALDSILLIRRMAQVRSTPMLTAMAFSNEKKKHGFNSALLQGPYSEIKMQMDKVDPLAHPLLQWCLHRFLFSRI